MHAGRGQERGRRAQAENLNNALVALADADDDGVGMTVEEQQGQISNILNDVYERLDVLDVDTAEVHARQILRGLGFTHEMMAKATKYFSGGWSAREPRDGGFHPADAAAA